MLNPKITINPDDSITNWVVRNGVKTEKGDILSWDDRPFLIDILNDWSRKIVIKKCAQVGGSVTFNLKVFYATDHFRWNIIYTMPTDGDVEDFVKTKTNELIKANSHIPIFASMSQDSIHTKEINGRFIHFKGTISRSASISTSSDVNVHDEGSRSDQKSIKTYESRYADSPFQGQWIFSNPTTEKDVVDEQWKKSDQKEWMATCSSCLVQQSLTWPDSINKEKQCYQCKMCFAELPDDARLFGEWVAQMPGREISGYHMTQMMRISKSAKQILEDAEGDQEFFFNFVLGEPYNPGDLSVSRGTIIDCWTPKDMWHGPYFLGVDVGNIKHFVLGTATTVLKMGRFTKWSELDDLIAFYKPQCFVIDAMPDNTAARAYVENHTNCFMSFFGENENNPMMTVWWGEKERRGIVYSNRNRILDQLITDIVEAKYLFACDTGADFSLYLKHWETMRRVKEVNAKGIERYVWTSTTGEDHYCFATLYWHLATLGYGNGVFISEERDANVRELIGNNNVMEDLGAVMAANNNWDFKTENP